MLSISYGFLGFWGFGVGLGKFLCPVVKAMNARLVAFRDQVRLRFEPVLHLVAGQRTRILVAEIGAARDFVRRRRENLFRRIQVRHRGGPGRVGRRLGLRLRMFIMFHAAT